MGRDNRKVEPWETAGNFLWTLHRGVWHVASVIYRPDASREYRAILYCGHGTVTALAVTQDTGFHLKNTQGRGFCRECKTRIMSVTKAKGRAE